MFVDHTSTQDIFMNLIIRCMYTYMNFNFNFQLRKENFKF